MAHDRDIVKNVQDSVRQLITSYNDHNSQTIHELHQEPSPLEFMRYVARNTPFVIRGAASTWKATQQWNQAYLKSALQGQNVNVAITPDGRADAPVAEGPERRPGIAKPLEQEAPFHDFLDYVIQQETDPNFPTQSEVRYAQTQNDNLRNEYLSLFKDVQKDIPFARIALEKEPDAINLWVGNSRSVTALHRDPMENIYVQIIGQKHFVLLSPLCQPCVNEEMMWPATYEKTDDGLFLQFEESIGGDQSLPLVPLATWDPDDNHNNKAFIPREARYTHLAKPMLVTLNPGDMLYLPAMWYHKVTQSCPKDGEGFVVAVNYWHDMDYSGPFYSVTNFVRDIGMERTLTAKRD